MYSKCLVCINTSSSFSFLGATIRKQLRVRQWLVSCWGTPQQDGCIAARNSGILVKWRKPQFTLSPPGSELSCLHSADPARRSRKTDRLNLQWTELHRFIWVSTSVYRSLIVSQRCRVSFSREKKHVPARAFFLSLLLSFVVASWEYRDYPALSFLHTRGFASACVDVLMSGGGGIKRSFISAIPGS